jgi:hypothetical protein
LRWNTDAHSGAPPQYGAFTEVLWMGPLLAAMRILTVGHRIITLRIDSLVEILAAFVKVIPTKNKQIYQ